jgi:GxxExxY protein
MDLPQRHKGTEDTYMDLPQRHKDTEDAHMDLPQRHKGTEGTYMDLPQGHKGADDTLGDLTTRRAEVDAMPINLVTQRVIGCAIEVHRVLGPGLLESIYETAMCIEMNDVGLRYERQVMVPANYKGHALGHHRIDLIVEDLVVVDIKSVERPNAIFEAQVLTYLRLTGKRLGLIINFTSALLKDGVKRLAL